MRRQRVVAIVQAGGAGSRMDVLTRERAKPALPFAGVYQLLDLPLSSLAHSGIDDVWLSVQYQGTTLEEQVASGRPWGLDRDRGGLRLLMPQQGTGGAEEEGFAAGNADELYRIRDEIRAADPDVVLVMSADHVYTLDHAEVVRGHLSSGVECTVVVTEVDDVSDHARVSLDGDRVVEVTEKPDATEAGTVAAEITAYDPGVLVEVLETLHAELSEQSGEGDSGLGDFAEHLLPRLVRRGRTVAHRLPGYWRDLGRPGRYLQAHLDLLVEDHDVLGSPDWPILTQQPQRRPARVREGAAVADSLLSPGTTVAGTVRRSVLGPGVVVEAGAHVEECVLFADVRVEADAHLQRAVVDVGSRVRSGARVGSTAGPLEDDAVVLVGRGCDVPAGARLPSGARLEPGTTA